MRRCAQIEADWQARLAAAGFPDPAGLLNADQVAEPGGGWEPLLKPGLGGRQRWRWQLNGAGAATLYLKRYVATPLAEQLDRVRRQAGRHSRAWWEFHQSQELRKRYVPAVRAIAFAEQMRGPYEVCSAVLCEEVPGDALDRLWLRLCADHAAVCRPPARHELVCRLAQFVSAFHQTGVCHRDLYLCHVFADVDPAAGRPPRFTLIDLARTHRPRLRRLRWLIKDLAQLDCSARQIGATRTDRLRFLVTYLGLAPTAPRVRHYAQRIVRKSSRILRRIARQSRPA